MLDPKYFAEKIDDLIQGLQKRNVDTSLVEEIKNKSEKRRKTIHEVERLKALRNQVTQEIAAAKKSGQNADVKIKEMREVGDKIKNLEQEMTSAQEAFESLALTLPNIPHSSVPSGRDSSENKVVRTVGEIPKFSFEPKDHVDIGEKLGILDQERATKITGARFSVLRGSGAKLERSLVNFMLDVHTKEHKYEEVWTPFMVNRQSLIGTGQLPKFEQDLFKLDGQDYFLIPTAEVPVTNIFANEVLDIYQLPIRMTAYTPCFRSEAGSYGKDTRGLIRQHQFDKVELVKFVHPDRSEEEHENLVKDAEAILQRLELPYRVVLLCGGDMGFAAAKCYDIEVWLPSANTYREISSCSNFLDFQARRAQIRFKPGPNEKPRFVHTLNGSGLAVGRTWLAILENFQQEDGTVLIPRALQDYIGMKHLKPQS
ncbi:MAG: serine--tRNA ligase [Bacteriovoracia bacterium]